MKVDNSRSRLNYNGKKQINRKFIIVVTAVLAILVLVLSLFFMLNKKGDKKENNLNTDKVNELSTQMMYTSYKDGEIVNQYITKYFEDGKHVICENNQPLYMYEGARISEVFNYRLSWIYDMIDKYKSSPLQKYNESDYQYTDGSQFGLWQYVNIQKFRYDVYGEAFKTYVEGRLQAGADIMLVVDDYSTSEIYMKEINGTVYRFIVADSYIIMGEYKEKEVTSLKKYTENTTRSLTEEEKVNYGAVTSDNKHEADDDIK